MMIQKLWLMLLLSITSGYLFPQDTKFPNSEDFEYYRLAILEEGVYKIDAQVIQSLGLNPAQIQPGALKLYTMPGGMLEQVITSETSSQYTSEIPSLVINPTASSFEEGGFVVFYAQGPDRDFFDPSSGLMQYETNLYADTNYVFLCPLDIAETSYTLEAQASLESPSYPVDYSDAYVFYENERLNLLKSGRNWYGEEFGLITNRSVALELENPLANAALEFQIKVIGKDTRVTSFDYSINGVNLGTQEFFPLPDGIYDPQGNPRTGIFQSTTQDLNISSNAFNLDLFFDQQGGNGRGFLDNILINYQKELVLDPTGTILLNRESRNHPVSEFRLRGVSSTTQIWDISQAMNPKIQAYNVNGEEAQFAVSSQDQVKKFIAFDPQQVPRAIANGQLPSFSNRIPSGTEMLIFSPQSFLSEAQRLADHRFQQDGLPVTVIPLQQVYWAYSAGRPDITAIRNFVYNAYEPAGSLKYVLLFGDASFDYKDRTANNTNFIPIYESRESLHPIFSYSSDDYFGFLEIGEGEWNENTQGDHSLEVGVGRLPVSSLAEAKLAVDKIIHYEQNQNTYGDWRNKVCFVADDGDFNIHQRDADRIAEIVENGFSDFNSIKLYLDSFEQEATPSGELVPDLVNALNQAVEEGVLILNYSGHGGELGLTDERVVDISLIRSWTNLDNMPLFVTATCEFGRYDDPNIRSGAEEVLLNPQGGGIALITTTRPVFASTNFQLNQAFYETVFTRDSGGYPRLGDVIRVTKNNSLSGQVNRNFSLLGDPSMRLAYPDHQAVVTRINGKELAQADTLRALDLVTLEGEVQNNAGQLLNGFSGMMDFSVFDKRQVNQTLGSVDQPMDYLVRNSVLFRGQVSVNEGLFTATFPIPKDIDYRLGKGKLSLYALSNTQNLDANRGINDIVIGGSAPDIGQDRTPPSIGIFLNNGNFQSGDVVGTRPLLIVKLSDESGINISRNNIGHEITARLDDGSEPIILNDFYQADLDSYQSGTVTFPMSSLKAGNYTLTIKAWDIYNNSSEAEVAFRVESNSVLPVSDFRVFPNPSDGSRNTSIRINHGLPDQALDVLIDVYSSHGKLVYQTQETLPNSQETIELQWNGGGLSGRRLDRGIYWIKVRLSSPENNASTELIEKILFIN